MKYPIKSSRQYKSLIRNYKKQPKTYTAGTSEDHSLQNQLIKEFSKTQKLIQLSQQIHKKKLPRKNKRLQGNSLQIASHQEEESPELSPLTLRRRFIARATRIKHQAAHQAAKVQAAAAQAQPPHNHSRLEKKTENDTTTNRLSRLTPFKDGFEKDTERELAQAFHRPPRLFKQDSPFYPWPTQTSYPLFNLSLNFKG